MDYTEARKGLPRIIFQRCPIPAGSEKVDMWNRVVTLTVSRSYATIRCNVNNEVKKAFRGEFRPSYCCPYNITTREILLSAYVFCRHLFALINRGPGKRHNRSGQAF